ncbi:uncharacterized protein LOC116853043 [Odontomachus brunneus]|uniref:uncharacterized protein LOC116853043 n=1 Tax=Odontomachus brunneus TaxID=486640 RepID=UPI0013F19122|nr:uncharacterized protein LOC116853043 [Odontomachus brunneus]
MDNRRMEETFAKKDMERRVEELEEEEEKLRRARAKAEVRDRATSPFPDVAPDRRNRQTSPLSGVVLSRRDRATSSLRCAAFGGREALVGEDGSLLIGLTGSQREGNAETFVKKLREVVLEARVSRPSRAGEIGIVRIDESVLPDEVVDSLAACGGCGWAPYPSEGGRRGMGAAWVQLSLAAAITVAKEGRLTLGWTTARVKFLSSRPLQC